jgi:hypothetical protein
MKLAHMAATDYHWFSLGKLGGAQPAANGFALNPEFQAATWTTPQRLDRGAASA